MNVLLINHYAGSPEMGMEYRPYYLAKEWIKLGHSVTILVANNSHIRIVNPVLKSDFFEEDIDGIKYVWLKTKEYEGNGLGRIRNIFDFVFKIYRNIKEINNKYKPDAVIASSTYPSDNYVAKKIAKRSGAKYIYEVHDLWPLSPMELGGMSKYHPFIMLMQHGENFAYRNADAVISMLPKTQEHMKSHGLDLKKWYYIPNCIEISEWEHKEKLQADIVTIIEEIKQKYNKIVAYTGTLGLANDLDTLIYAAKNLTDYSTAIVIVGKGPEKDNLVKLVKEEKITNVFFIESIRKQQIPALLELFDFLYIGLQYQSLFRFGISPNKLIDYMMSGKPVIQAIDAGNNIVEEASCGLAAEPENPDAVSEAIIKLMNTKKEELKQMGQNGKNFVMKNHVYSVLAKQFIEIINKI